MTCLFVYSIVCLQGAEVEKRDRGCVSSYCSTVPPGCTQSYHHKGLFRLDKNKQPSMQKLDFPPVSRSGRGAAEISGVIRLCCFLNKISFHFICLSGRPLPQDSQLF